ncbi:MAG: cysteine desulfurase [Tissierellia bacterium]|nr:cysteine desulfurase [Tissierellia bacterium]
MIYLDNAATTKVDDEAIEKMIQCMKMDYANPSSLYDFGLRAEKLIDKARIQIARALNVDREEIYFTSCGTESNNIAIQGSLTGNVNEEFITTVIEHPAVFNPLKKISENRTVYFIPVDKNGFISVDNLIDRVNENTRLVSVMHVNNELGSIQAISEIGRRIKEKNPNTIFHVDGIQGFGKIYIEPKKANVDIYTMSGHKIHAPKGIGCMYINKDVKINPIIQGGGQEFNISPGTENVPGIVAMGHMAEKMVESIDENFEKIFELKKYTLNRLAEIEDIHINSILENSSPYIINVCFEDIKSEILLHYLEGDEIYISTGSACSKNKLSRIIDEIGISNKYSDGCIRISFSDESNKEEVDIFIERLKYYIDEIRSITRR